MPSPVAFIAGNSNLSLFKAVAAATTGELRARGFGVKTLLPRKSTDPETRNTFILEKFSNGELHIDICENVRGHVVWLMQTGDNSDDFTINDNLMALILLISTCKLSSAAEINVIIPSLFYARQDKKDRSRVPISAKTVANMLQDAGASRVVVVDLHSAQIQGFFDIPVDNLYAVRYMRAHLEKLISTSGRPRSDFVLVSPDLGGEKRIHAYSKAMGLPFVLAAKARDHSKASVIERIHVYGSVDCRGKIGIIIDDMVDTAGTMVTLVNDGLQVECDFTECWVAVTHGILSGAAVEKLNSCPLITRVICTNTLARETLREQLPKLEIVDISALFARAIVAIETDSSISALFESAEPPTPLYTASATAPSADITTIDLAATSV